MGTPIYSKTREVQLAAGGRQVAQIVSFIDAQIFGTPIHRKTREVQFVAGGRQIAPTFPLIEFKFEFKFEFSVRFCATSGVRTQLEPKF